MTPGQGPHDGSSRIGRLEGAVYVVLPIILALASGGRYLAEVLAGGLVNPDSYMRLLRLEDMLRQHAILHVVPRDGSGAGALLHWSHLLDALLCLAAMPLVPFVGAHAALHAAAAAFGPLSLGALGLALAWAAAPLSDPGWRWLAPVAATLSVPIISYGLPGVAHHHVPLLLVAVMTGGYALRSALGSGSADHGLAMGAWAGVGIWLSPESMPFSLLAFSAVWLAWLLRPECDLLPMIRRIALGFLLVVAAALAVDPPYAGYAAAEIDRISVIYLALALAVGVMALAAPRARGMASRLAIPVLCLTAWLALFPAVLRGPNGLMSPAESQAMLSGIIEMLPVRGVAEANRYLLGGVLAFVVMAWLALARRSPLLGYATLCIAALVWLGSTHVRFAAYPAAAAAVLLPILITLCNGWLADWSEAGRAGVRLTLMATFVLLPHADGLPALWSPASAAAGQPAATCAASAAATLLMRHPGEIVLSDPGDVPALLYRTPVMTVGSLYHRNVAAFMRLRAAWRSEPSASLPSEVRATGARLILFCPTPARSPLVADLPPTTLLDRLAQDQVPPWLHRVAADPSSGHVLYEVTP